MPEPDWEALQRITSDAERLSDSERLTPLRFSELLNEATAAAGDEPELVESVMLFAPAGYTTS
jgi:hypothetical protein